MSGIMEILHKKKISTISDLASAMGVSVSTIRRDIEKLVENELVLCKKNSVVPISELSSDLSIAFRSNINAAAKNAIAREAVKLIKDNSTIIMDSSSTALCMTEHLFYRHNLTIITNSIAAVEKLRGSKNKLILIGGKFSERSYAFIGEMAEECIKNYNYDMSFISSVAITKLGYAAETVAGAAAIRRIIFSHSAKNVLLCDSSKMQIERSFNIAHIDEFDYIITNDKVYPQNTRAQVIRV